MAPNFKIITWNIWFNEFKTDIRMKEIARKIHELQPHVFCLQEVTFSNLNAFLTNLSSFGDIQYQISTDLQYFINLRSAYFNLIFSRIPFKKRYLPIEFNNTNQGRKLSMATVMFEENEINISTVHLESPVKKIPSFLERKEQLEFCFEKLENHKNCILAGDTNWNSQSNATIGPIQCPINWKDIWLFLQPNNTGNTYDGTTNKMLFHPLKARLDRIFYKTEKSILNPLMIKLIGTEPIKNAFTTLKNGKKKPKKGKNNSILKRGRQH